MAVVHLWGISSRIYKVVPLWGGQQARAATKRRLLFLFLFWANLRNFRISKEYSTLQFLYWRSPGFGPEYPDGLHMTHDAPGRV